MYGGISECHRNHSNHIACVANNNINNNIGNTHNHHRRISITKDEIDRFNAMNEDDLENLINQTIQERWQNALHAVSQQQQHHQHHHHHDVSSTDQQLTDGEESSTLSLSSNISSDDDETHDSTMLISENAAKALSRSFSQTMY